MFTPCLLWKTKQSRGGRSSFLWTERQCQVDLLGFIFPDVGRWWELSLCRHRLWWVCVRYKKSVQVSTCIGVFVYGVSAWVEVCRVQHGFVSGRTGPWRETRCSLVLVLWDGIVLGTLHCPVPLKQGIALSCRLYFLSSHGHMQQSPLGLARAPLFHLPTSPDLHFEPLTLPWESKKSVSIAVWEGEGERRKRPAIVGEIGCLRLGLGRLGFHYYRSNSPEVLAWGRGQGSTKRNRAREPCKMMGWREKYFDPQIVISAGQLVTLAFLSRRLALPGNCFALNFLSRRIIFPRLQLNLHFSTRHLGPTPMKSERKRLGPKWP